MKVIELRSQTIQARPVPVNESNGTEMYEMAFLDKDTGDIIFLRFNREVRDNLVAQLHGSGLVVAKDFPH